MIGAKNEGLSFNQVLHGYNEGHRLLAGSVRLDKQSTKTMLALSDLPAQGLDPRPDGYITGYPLSEIGAYALARTWPATEMPRPGCVWTHTLLIDFSDLASIATLAILKLFKRPSKVEGYSFYMAPVSMRSDTSYGVNCETPLSYVASVVGALYGTPTESVVVENTGTTITEEIILSLWFQQWPRLRRKFRFCTWGASVRSRPGEMFDLQFVEMGRLAKYRNIDREALDKHKQYSKESWATLVARDALFESRNSTFRKFLWEYGAETDAGRKALKPLTIVWQAIESHGKPDLVIAIRVATKIQPPINSLTRRILCETVRAIAQSDFVPPSVIQYLIENLSLLDINSVEVDLGPVAETISQHNPKAIWKMLSSNSTSERRIAEEIIRSLNTEDALTLSENDAVRFCQILEIKPELATSSLVWNAPEPLPSRSLKVVAARGEPCQEILLSMLKSSNEDLPVMAIDAFGQTVVDFVVTYKGDDGTAARILRSRWIAALRNQPDLLLKAVADGIVADIDTLAQIAAVVDYRSPAISPRGDEWVRALSNVQGVEVEKKFAFYAFLLARALSGISTEAAVLFRVSFDVVHNALMGSKAEESAWRMLEKELPEIGWWNTWDRANRVRRGVVEFYVRNNLPSAEFLSVTKSEKVFRKLVDTAGTVHGGIGYLERIVHTTTHSVDGLENNQYDNYLRAIDRYLKNVY